MSLWVVKPYNKDRLLGIRATKKKERWEFSPPSTLEPSALKGLGVIALDTSPRVYFSKETINKGPKEIIFLQAEDKVREAGYFTGSFLTAVHKLSESQTTLETGIMAVEPEGVNRLVESLSQFKAKIKGIYHQTTALAHLVSRISKEPVLAIWASLEGIWMIVCEPGGPSYMRFQEGEEVPIEEGISVVLGYYERFFGKTISKVFPCGPKRDIIPEIENLEPVRLNLEGLINANEEDVLTYPELFGAVFVPEGYNFLPEKQRFFFRNLEWMRPVAGLLLILTFINLGLGAYFYRQSRTLSAEIVDKRESLERVLSALKSYPPSQIEALEKYVDARKNFEQQPRLDEFLIWLSNNLPPDMKVSSIKTCAKGHELEMELFLNGSASLATESFYSFLNKVRAKFQVVDTYFHYDEIARKGSFRLKVKCK